MRLLLAPSGHVLALGETGRRPATLGKGRVGRNRGLRQRPHEWAIVGVAPSTSLEPSDEAAARAAFLSATSRATARKKRPAKLLLLACPTETVR